MQTYVKKLITASVKALIETQSLEANIDMIFDILDYVKASYSEDEVYEMIERKYPILIDSRGLPDEGIPHGTCDHS